MGDARRSYLVDKAEYDALVCTRDKVEILKNMIVRSEIQSWEQALIILGDIIAYDEYTRAKLEGDL